MNSDNATRPSPLLWWAYRHTNGSVSVKRFFDPRDTAEAWDSDFVAMVAGPYEADTREEAVAYARGVLL